MMNLSENSKSEVTISILRMKIVSPMFFLVMKVVVIMYCFPRHPHVTFCHFSIPLLDQCFCNIIGTPTLSLRQWFGIHLMSFKNSSVNHSPHISTSSSK